VRVTRALEAGVESPGWVPPPGWLAARGEWCMQGGMRVRGWLGLGPGRVRGTGMRGAARDAWFESRGWVTG